jgi:hypothetical protein
MDLKTLLDTPPWDWPTDAGRMFQKILIDQRADESDRLVAAELAGDFTVINDDLADTLFASSAALCGTREGSAILNLSQARHEVRQNGRTHKYAERQRDR